MRTILFLILLATPLAAQSRDSVLLHNLALAKAEYDANPASADATIWYGRRLAYLGRYPEAIRVYTAGIARHPTDARLYRHRGHRYITMREFDNAIRDLQRAAELVEGKPDEVEPDGAPNKYNVPVGTLHHNIYYHLALAHYLKHDFKRALPLWRETVRVSANDDALVAASDWLYMTLRRLGRDNEARAVLEPIKREMRILENAAYHRRLLMYKSELPLDSLLTAHEDAVQIATYGYGIGNWHLYNGRRAQAVESFRRILDQPNWAAFGYIAAEAELARMPETQPMIAARQYRQRHEAEILKEFAELLAIPNVATDASNIQRNARAIADAFRAAGVQTSVLQRPGAAPLVYGQLSAPKAKRTIGIYVHYDGQPVDPREWRTAPFEPALYDGSQRIAFPRPGEAVHPEWRMYARSASDDKAPLIALLTVLRALRERNIVPTWNIKFLFDGEEEAGSPNLPAYIAEHGALFGDVDGWLFFDGPVHPSRRPAIVFGARGVVDVELTLYGAIRGLHSGHYGNWAPNPALMLAQLLGAMKNADGRVLIPGFYDSVAPIGEDERAALAALPDFDAQLKRELGLARTENPEHELPETLLMPSLNIRGIASGATGTQANNVIPATATASLDIRLVKGNDPERMLDLLEAFVRQQGYHIVRQDPDMATRLAHPRIAKIERGHGNPAAKTPMSHPLGKAVIAAARTVAGDQLMVIPTLGGTLPLDVFTNVLEKPVIIVPIANHDNNQHSANENLRIANLWYAIDLYAALIAGGANGLGQ